MEFIFGRDPATCRLKITVEGKTLLWGDPNSVDNSVSRQHLKLEVNDDGTKVLTNINPANATKLNGNAIIKKKFELDDNTVVELGMNGYKFKLNEIVKKFVKETVSIGHLKQVIDGYRKAKLDMQIGERKQNAMRGLMPVFMALAGIVGFTNILEGPIKILPSVLLLLLSGYFGYVGFVSASRNPLKGAELDQNFRNKYVCPKCGHSLNGEYSDLLNAGQCPWCHTRFKE